MATTKNITISIESSSTPLHKKANVVFTFINENNEKEIELNMDLTDGKIKKSSLSSRNANIKLLNLCSEFIEKLSIQEFD